MKAIETRYRGYRFRSRLEARWAVFFDAMGFRWEYEPEGFDMGGELYLPDFWLPDASCWVEIKHADAMRPLDKPIKLRDEGAAVVVFKGLPHENWGYLLAYDFCDSGGGHWEDFVLLCRLNRTPAFVTHLDTRVEHDRRICTNMEFTKQLLVRHEKAVDWETSAYKAAVNAARGARFEHGEGRPFV